MKKTFRKITASLAAAVLCAVPVANSLTANAYANDGARYTFRKVFYVPNDKNIGYLVFGVACSTSGTDAPVADKIASGTLTPGQGGGPGCHNAGGTFYPDSKPFKGAMVSVHMFCNKPSDYNEKSYTNYAYTAAGNPLSSGTVLALDTFLVGDIDRNNIIDGNDSGILDTGLNQNVFANKKFNETVKINGTNYDVYKFDINDDGVISTADLNMLRKYERSNTYRFSK